MNILSLEGYVLSITGGSKVSLKPIVPINKMVVVDPSGNIGLDITNYFQYIGSTYNYSFAVMVEGAD